MTSLDSASVPILSCAAAGELERGLFAGDEALEWKAMRAAGAALADGVQRDFEELGGLPATTRILVLVGKGHNGGDALIAAHALLERIPGSRADVVFVFGERALRPLTARAWRDAAAAVRQRVVAVPERGIEGREYDLCLDGIFGFQFRPPADQKVTELLRRVNATCIHLRAAVDLPSADLFRADFTYATGSVKEPLLDNEMAGRVRYLDLGFFDGASSDPAGWSDSSSQNPAVGNRAITGAVLDNLRRLRPARCDKRSFGHVFLVGGSRGYPGAIFMATAAAVRTGAGLVTSFVPESLAPTFAAQLPEAIWVGWPETPDGGLALEGQHLLSARIDRSDALVLGPGSGRESETLALMAGIVKTAAVPLVIDADALQPEIVLAGKAARTVTPHAGEFKRIAGDADLRTFASHPGLTVVLKGPVTRLCDGGAVFHSLSGGPVLARGGSGDLLAGMIGTQLAQTPADPLLAAARAVEWHGRAADALARRHGQVAVRAMQLLDGLRAALDQESGVWKRHEGQEEPRIFRA